MKLSQLSEIVVNHAVNEDPEIMIFCASEGEALHLTSRPKYEPVSNTLQFKIDLNYYLEQYFSKHYPKFKKE